MDQLLASSALWAMHPAFLEAHLKHGSLEALLPEAVRRMMSGNAPEARAADPVREGATLIFPISGVLGPRGFNVTTYYEQIADRAREAAADPKDGAVVFSVRSPGGYVWGCAEAGVASQ